jgi:2-oxoglutarate ferredoxin oxidoreductase subunit gamma
MVVRKEMRIAGFGGQGVVLAGQIVGQAIAIFDKKHAAFTQNYGPESRGGSCTVEIVASDEPVDYPYVVSPGIVIIISQDAYHKYGRGLPPDTTVIIDPDLVKMDTADTRKALLIPANRMARELGRVVVANIVLLGFLAAVSDFVSAEALRQSILISVPKGTGEFNLKAFELGYNYGREQGKGSGQS